jgi:hypothetical protein
VAIFAANILEPRFGAVWAHVQGKTPPSALGAVLVMDHDRSLWEAEPPQHNN